MINAGFLGICVYNIVVAVSEMHYAITHNVYTYIFGVNIAFLIISVVIMAFILKLYVPFLYRYHMPKAKFYKGKVKSNVSNVVNMTSCKVDKHKWVNGKSDMKIDIKICKLCSIAEVKENDKWKRMSKEELLQYIKKHWVAWDSPLSF